MTGTSQGKVGFWERFLDDAPRLECPQCRHVFFLASLRWKPRAASSERYSCPECKFASAAEAFRRLSPAEIRQRVPAPSKKPFLIVAVVIGVLFAALMAWVSL